MQPHRRPGHPRRGRGKKLRAALQYVARSQPTPEESDIWKSSGWTGCKLWGACQGTRCKDGDPDENGRDRFRTPVLLPTTRPSSVHPVDRRVSRCPLTYCDPWMWSAINTWHVWSTFGSLPDHGPLGEQPARLLEAISIIDSESTLVQAYRSEVASRRAKMKGP